VSGVIKQISVKQGQQATVGQVIGVMEEGQASAAQPAAPAAAGAPFKPVQPPVEEEVPVSRARESIPPQGFARVMPSARRALAEKGLSAEEVKATGPGGRLLKEDVARHAQPPARAETPAPPPAP